MNLLDAVIVLATLGAGFAGYRFGFLARALSWLGLIIGAVIGVLYVDDVAGLLSGSTPRTRLLASLAFVVLVTAVGQMAGVALGAVLRRHLWRRATWSGPDRIAGAVAGVLAVLGAVWLVTPALASASGWPARAARGSAIVRAVDRWAPEPPGSIAALGRLVGDAPFPEVFDRLTSPDAGPVPTSALDPAIALRVERSVVKIEGRACDEIQQGSGFVAAPELVVTNAHVVAGERSTSVLTPDGRRLGAVVVAFHPDRDLAVLRVRGLGLEALTRGEPSVDQTGSVFGYPGGGPLEESPARLAQQIVARGTDIYRDGRTIRDVLVLAAQLAPGDSGGPLVDARGHVVGVAFAVDPSDSSTAYALTRMEVDAVLEPVVRTGSATEVDTGPCLLG